MVILIILLVLIHTLSIGPVFRGIARLSIGFLIVLHDLDVLCLETASLVERARVAIRTLRRWLRGLETGNFLTHSCLASVVLLIAAPT